MELRKVNFNDYDQIAKLHTRNKIKILDKTDWIDFWEKKPLVQNAQNEFPIGWILEKNKKIVGFLGNIIKEYYLENKKFIVACSHAWVVDKEFRLNSFSLMNNFFSQDNVDLFITSTPNKTSENFFLRYGAKKLSSKDLEKDLFLILDTKNFLYSLGKYYKISFNIFANSILSNLFNFFFSYKINYWKKFNYKNKIKFNYSFSQSFQDLWQEIKNKNKKFMQSKSPNWLNWHIKMFKKVWITTLIYENEIKGYAICCERNNENYNLKRISIIDVVSIENDKDIYLSLINNCIKKSYELGYYVIDMTATNKIKKDIFSTFKTFNRKTSNYLFYYYSKNEYLMKILDDENIWDTTLLDGDAFLA